MEDNEKIQQWIQDLNQTNSHHFHAVVNHLVARQKQTLPLILESLKTAEKSHALWLTVILLRIGKPAVSPIIEHLSYTDNQYRLRLVWVLDRIGDPSAIAPLSTMRPVTDPDLSKAIVDALISLIARNPHYEVDATVFDPPSG